MFLDEIMRVHMRRSMEGNSNALAWSENTDSRTVTDEQKPPSIPA
jgi:hypothetical protein